MMVLIIVRHWECWQADYLCCLLFVEQSTDWAAIEFLLISVTEAHRGQDEKNGQRFYHDIFWIKDDCSGNKFQWYFRLLHISNLNIVLTLYFWINSQKYWHREIMNIFCFQRHILNAFLVTLIFFHHQSQKELILIQKIKKFLIIPTVIAKSSNCIVQQLNNWYW